MKVRITFELSDDDRRAIAHHNGQTGKADYSTCLSTLEEFALKVRDLPLPPSREKS